MPALLWAALQYFRLQHITFDSYLNSIVQNTIILYKHYFSPKWSFPVRYDSVMVWGQLYITTHTRSSWFFLFFFFFFVGWVFFPQVFLFSYWFFNLKGDADVFKEGQEAASWLMRALRLEVVLAAIRERGSWRGLVLLEKQRTGICSGDRGAQTKRRLKRVARRNARTWVEVLVGIEDKSV